MERSSENLEEWTDSRLRAWMQARLRDRLLPDESSLGREEFPLWTELASLLDQACRPYSSGLDAGQAARIRQLAGEEIANFLKRPKASAADLTRGLQVLLRGCEMAERPLELQLQVGPVLLALTDRLEPSLSRKSVRLLPRAGP